MRHAVVLGAGIGGLLAARALSEAYETVTVVERDPLSPGPRRGVPQGRHAHVMVTSGAQVLDRLFPGFNDELVTAGAPAIEDFAEFRLAPGGTRPAALRGRPAAPFACLVSRPLLEERIRERIAKLSNVVFAEPAAATGLVGTATRITGVRMLRDGTENVLDADLVLDATGRASRAPAWLAALGLAPPPEERMSIDLMYVTRRLRLRPGALSAKVVGFSARPGRPTGLILFAQEDGRSILTVFGYGAAGRPPRDPALLPDAVAAIAPPEVTAAIRDAEMLGEQVPHRFPAGFRRRYDRMRRFPAGFLLIGDAICSTNPAYALGMSVAALQAEELRAALGDRDATARYLRAAARPANAAWEAARGGDLALPEVPGPRPLAVRISGVYARRALRAAERDPVVAGAFLRVASLQDPPTRLFRPAVAMRVLRHGA